MRWNMTGKKARPYVGVTGLVTLEEVRAVRGFFSRARYNWESPHLPMLGFLASYKTLLNLPTFNRRYPAFQDLPSLLSEARGTLAMIHYNSRELSTLSGQVFDLLHDLYGNGLCQALQLNIIWPDSHHVQRIKEHFPDLQLVFQASSSAMSGLSPQELGKKILAYGDVFRYALLDPSGGRGMPFSLEDSVAQYIFLQEMLPDVTIGFAGGFDRGMVTERASLLVERVGTTDFCIDAEGGLRDKLSSTYGDDVLNKEKVSEYLTAAALVLP